MPGPSEALLDVIRDWGTDRLFTCPGSTEAAVLDALVVRKDVELVLTTHETEEAAMRRALSRINGLSTVLEPPRMIRIESL